MGTLPVYWPGMFPREDPNPPIQLGLNQPPPAPAAPAAEPAALDFDRADFSAGDSGKTCAICGKTAEPEYYQLGGRDICPPCAALKRAERESAGALGFSRALLFGAGAALAGSALYAIISAVTGYQFSLIAIAIGWLVGRAVMTGTGGRGGRKYQILAVLLTYFAITTSYIPEMIVQLNKAAEPPAAGQPAATPAPESAKAPAPDGPPSALGYAVAVVLIIGLSFVLPFVALADGFSGIINLVIIAIGLQQAWRSTHIDDAALLGPYTTAEAPQS